MLLVWIPAITLGALIAAGIWYCAWLLRAQDKEAADRAAAMLRALAALAPKDPLPVAVVANDTAAPTSRESGEYPAAAPCLLTLEQRARLVHKVRPPGSPALSPEVYGAILQLEFVPAPWLPERCPGHVEEGRLCYRPGPYAARTQLIEIANELAAREGLRILHGDAAAIATALAVPVADVMVQNKIS